MNEINFIHDSFKKESASKDSTCALPKIYLVDDDVVLGKAILRFLQKKLNCDVIFFKSPTEFLEGIGHIPPGETFVLLTDIAFENSGADGLLLIDILREKNYSFLSIVMTGFASVKTAIQATKKGVLHYLTKPFDLDNLVDILVQSINSKLEFSREQLIALGQNGTEKNGGGNRPSFIHRKFEVEAPSKEDCFEKMIGRSPKMKEVFERIKKIANSDSTVLITGESGTGKELVARAIHSLSSKGQQRMVAVNCSAIPSELLESELFGHTKGSFTGAISNRIGRFELANNSSVFLDEIGDMPLLLQVKILRAIQNREIEPVGSSATVSFNARIITATHKNLEQAVAAGDFREDLYYRLNVIPLKIPPLRERREDIPLLVSFFLSKFVSADGRNKIEFTEDALSTLIGHNWPGNVRELENLIERLVILKGGSVVKISDLPAKFFQSRPETAITYKSIVQLPNEGLDLKDILSEIEDSLILQALDRTNGNKNQASKLLRLNRTTLIEKMKKKNLGGEDLLTE
ncbi:MAG TPA: sigma-54 dependent transcriptional regulator [Bacteriovoracaceae bacterium]|nr:sigma-54 dependent transcriptional regulator [Bacteriovoracaceae bacterium]